MPIKSHSLPFIAALCMCVCGGTGRLRSKSPAEIDTFLNEHPALQEPDRRCLEKGRFEIGISRETVRFMLGEPDSIASVRQQWATQEQWTYRQKSIRKKFIFENAVLVGILDNE